MIVHDDITGVDESTARRIIAVARSIASGIDDLEEGSEAHKNAIAILQGVADELPAAGEGRVKSLSRAGTAITYEAVRSAFSDDYRRALRALCRGGAPTGTPRGSFPIDSPAGRMWPEGGYS